MSYESINASIQAYYNKYVSARWWASWAMWIGIFAGLIEYVPDYLQAGLENLDILGGVFDWSDSTKRSIQAFLLFIVMPIARAWRQKSMQQAQIKQAAKNDLVVPLPASGVTPGTSGGTNY